MSDDSGPAEAPGVPTPPDGHAAAEDAAPRSGGAAVLSDRGHVGLREEDPELYGLLERELARQAEELSFLAASSVAAPSVLFCCGSAAVNVTGEGYPGERYHAGCQIVDDIERLAIERAREAFGARYANVQPHSGSQANACILFGLLRPGDAILAMDIDAGGHLTHGAAASVTGRWLHSVHYGVGRGGYIDYDEVRRVALELRPKLIICGASSYPRRIEFVRFRSIADEAGALLLADISHVAGLVVAGLHPSPIDVAHFTTTSTYKQLFGPRGGLILMGRDAGAQSSWNGEGTLAQRVQRAVFPGVQGTPDHARTAAKARALAVARGPSFRQLMGQIVESARLLASRLARQGCSVVTGGTDTHMVLVDVGAGGMSGAVAEAALAECSIVANRNRIPGDPKPPQVASGLRLGTNLVAARGLGEEEIQACARLIHRVLDAVEPAGDVEYRLPADVREAVREKVRELCRRFPLPGYPAH